MNKYIIHQIGIAEGVGDLIYMCKWFKLYAKYLPTANNKFHLLNVKNDSSNISRFISDLMVSEPEHPLLNYMRVVDGVLRYNPKLVFIQYLPKLVEEFIEVKNIFNDISAEDEVFLFSISSKPMPLTNGEKEIFPLFIEELEYEAYDSTEYSDEEENVSQIMSVEHAHEEDDDYDEDNDDDNEEDDEDEDNQSLPEHLGVGKETFGLLFDDTLQNTNHSMQQLPSYLKQKIDEKADISKCCYIFGYMQTKTDINTLISIATSPWLADQINQNKMPVFILTGIKHDQALPNLIIEMESTGKIIVVKTDWLPIKEYNNLRAALLHKHSPTVVIPSGDNSLTDCLQTGHIPFYAFPSDEDQNYKSKIFEQLANMMQQELNQDASKPGYINCLQLFKALATRVKSETVDDHYYVQRGLNLTTEAVEYFKTISQHIVQNYSFEHYGLPRIIKKVSEFYQNSPDAPKRSKLKHN